MRSLDQVLASPVVGNAHSDHNLWQELYAYALARSVPIADRAKAIRKMDEVTGEPESEGKDDEALVRDFVGAMWRDCEVPEYATPESYGE